MHVGRFYCFDGDLGSGFGKCGEDAAGVQPADSLLAEDVLPIEITGFEFAGSRVAPIRNTDGSADTEAAFRKIEAIAHGAADAVIFDPLDKFGRDAALHDEIFDEVSDFI